MSRSTRILLLMAFVVLAAACGRVDDPKVAGAADAAKARLPASSVSTTQATAVPWATVLNPVDELQAFAPDGLLRWTAVEGADVYEVWAYDSSGTEVKEFSKALAGREYRFTQLLPESQYRVVIYARVAGEWIASVPVYLETIANALEPRLGNPQEELEAFAANGTLRWTPVAGADRYEVWIYQDRGLQALVENSGPLRATQYPVRSLPAGRSYYVQLWSRVNGEFYAGGALQVAVVADSSRARIVNPQEELDAFASDGLLRWSAAPGAASYEVWIFDDPNSASTRENSGPLATRTYRTRTLEPGRTYYVQVYALVDGAWQVGSPVRISTASVVEVARLSNPQEEIEAFATGGTLRWNAVPGADRYEVWIYGNAGLGVVSEVGFPPGMSYTVGRLCRDGVYYVELWARVGGTWRAGWATRLNVTQGESPAQCVPPVPMVSFTSEPHAPRPGQSVTLTWTSRFADRCTAYEDWTGTRPTGGSEVAGPLWTATRFGLACEGPSGTTRAYLYVVLALPKYAATPLPLDTAAALNEAGDVSGANLFPIYPSTPLDVPCPAAFLGGQFIFFLPHAIPPGWVPCYSGTALDVNAAGEVVIGSGWPPSGTTWHLYRDGAIVPLDGFSPTAINDLGHVAGGVGLVSQAAVWVDGVVTPVPTPEGMASFGYDINAHGVLVGDSWQPDDIQRLRTRAFVVGTSGTVDLDSLGGEASHAEAVNDAGMVVGWSRTLDGAQHAVRWGPSGIVDLGTLGCSPSEALGINGAGHVVGQSCAVPPTSMRPASGVTSAFLYASGFMYDLNDQLAYPLDEYWKRMRLVRASDINGAGQIVADACSDLYPRDCTAYLLTPVPEE